MPPQQRHPELETYDTNLRRGLGTPWIRADSKRIFERSSVDTGVATHKDGWSGHTKSVFACPSCLFGFSCQHSSSPDPHSNLYQSHTEHAYSRHDLRVVLQVGLQRW